MIRLIRIKKPLARKMYYSGHKITVVPCKCGVNNEVGRMEIITLENGGKEFDRLIREFEWYNCNKDTGYYAHYYVTETDMNIYNMCQSMCSASL